MNFAATKNTASNYPDHYIRDIHATYQEHGAILKDLATAERREDVSGSYDADTMEEQLLQGQEKLLDLVANMKPSSFNDVSDILKLWYDVAIKDVAPHDVRLTDALVLVVHNYIGKHA